jgi:septal ring factor EnvC (AmiA/AmiB activator)
VHDVEDVLNRTTSATDIRLNMVEINQERLQDETAQARAETAQARAETAQARAEAAQARAKTASMKQRMDSMMQDFHALNDRVSGISVVAASSLQVIDATLRTQAKHP